MASYTLTIGGVTVKTPTAISSLDINDIWNSEAGRSTTGDFIGDIINTKDTFTVSWKFMTHAEFTKLINALPNKGNGFAQVKLVSNCGDILFNAMAYKGTVKRVPIFNPKVTMYSDVSVDIVQQ